MERTESARASFAGLVGADDDEIAVTASVSAGVNAIASGLPTAAGRDQDRRLRLRVPDRRPDLARAGGRAATRSPTCRRATRPSCRWRRSTPRSTSARRSSRSRRSATATAPASTSRASSSSRTSAARSCCSTPTRPSASMPIDVHALDVDLLVAGALKYLLASAGLGFLYCRRDLVRAAAPDRDGLVRRRRRVRDGHPGLLAGRRRPPLPGGHAADPEHLRRASRASS